jgi:hypothetical protein
VDPAIIHKTDAAAVLIGIPDERAFRLAACDLWDRFPNATLLVMPSFPQGLELLAGLHTDPTFGPVVTFGRGGIWAEAENDVASIVGSVTTSRVERELRRLRIAPRLLGHRGQRPLAIGAFCELVVSMFNVAREHPDLDLEVNPVILYEDGYELADIRAFTSPASTTLDRR